MPSKIDYQIRRFRDFRFFGSDFRYRRSAISAARGRRFLNNRSWDSQDIYIPWGDDTNSQESGISPQSDHGAPSKGRINRHSKTVFKKSIIFCALPPYKKSGGSHLPRRGKFWGFGRGQAENPFGFWVWARPGNGAGSFETPRLRGASANRKSPLSPRC